MLGIVSDEEFESSLEDIKKPMIPIVIESPSKGRSDNDKNVPGALRSIIGETSNVESRKDALDLARAFNISDSSVSAYANGATSTATYDKPKSSIIEVITKSKNRIARKAAKISASAIEKISEDKLDACDAVELAQVAKSMASIIPMMEPPPAQGADTRPQIIQFFAPPMMQESKFETIVVKE